MVMTHSLGASHRFSQTALSQWPQWQGRDHIQARYHGLPLTNAILVLATAKCLICQLQRPTLSPDKAPFCGAISQLPAGRLITLGSFHHGRGSMLFPLEQTLALNMDLPSLHINTSAKTTICGLTECLTHDHGIPHSIASDQGTHFIAKEVWQ